MSIRRWHATADDSSGGGLAVEKAASALDATPNDRYEDVCSVHSITDMKTREHTILSIDVLAVHLSYFCRLKALSAIMTKDLGLESCTLCYSAYEEHNKRPMNQVLK